MGRFLGSLPALVQAPARRRAAGCELRTEEGDVVLSGSYDRCAAEVVKRCRVLFKGQRDAGKRWSYDPKPALPEGSVANRFAWAIVGPDGAVRTRHAITVLS